MFKLIDDCFRHHFGLSVYGFRLAAFGGLPHDEETMYIEEYDEEFSIELIEIVVIALQEIVETVFSYR